MCGILAIHDPAGGVTEAELRRGLAAMRHRGPDGDGVWISPDRTVGIGHVRLAVMDPVGGAQPLTNEDGTIVAAVNGEFYGHAAIRRDLEARGHVFRTRSDSEILVHLFEEQGAACYNRLRGEFAYVLWDARQPGRLWIARDPFGVKPLVYHLDGSRKLIASEVKALFAVGVKAEWDAAAVWQVCGMQYPAPNQTMFRGVRQLEPGCLGATGPCNNIGYGNIGQIRFPFDHGPSHLVAYPEADRDRLSTQLRAELDDPVRVRLQADVPVCFHLSGGLDSTAIVALARRHMTTRPVCFTVAFDGPGYDELEQARESAAFLGAELNDIPVSLRGQLDHLSDAVFLSEGLAINGHLTAKYLLAKAIRAAGFKVVLSGEGADEVFGGYAHFRQDLLADDPAALAKLHAANPDMLGIQLPEGEGLPLDAVQQRLGFVPAFLRAKATLGLRMRGLLRREFVTDFAAIDPYRVFLDEARAGTVMDCDRVNTSAYLWMKSALANYILRTLGDGTEMAHGVEGRLPFLDHVLFDFARRIPVGLKIRGGVEKWILREALKDVLPPAVYTRRKHPFTAPPLARYGRDFLRDHLRPHVLRDSPFFDPDAVGRYLDWVETATEREQTAADPALMLVLTSVLLQKRFGL